MTASTQIAGRLSLLQEYLDNFGGPAGPLGFPVTSAQPRACATPALSPHETPQAQLDLGDLQG